MTLIKKSYKLFLLFVGAVIALALFQVSIATADNSNAIASNSGKNGETSFDISHLQLDSSSRFDSSTFCRSWDGDGKTYDYSDSDGKYKISDLWMNCRTEDNEEKLALLYSIDTPDWDWNSDLFVVFTIYVDGKVFHTCFHEWVEDSDHIDNCQYIYKINTDDLVSQIGCTLCQGLKDGRIVIQMDDIVCSTH